MSADRPWARCGVVSPGTTKYTALNLTEGTTYLFRVSAINSEGISQPLVALDETKPVKMLCKYSI